LRAGVKVEDEKNCGRCGDEAFYLHMKVRLSERLVVPLMKGIRERPLHEIGRKWANLFFFSSVW
jgi:hypothetical protein